MADPLLTTMKEDLKGGLTDATREKRIKYCLARLKEKEHELDWVVWIDEASVDFDIPPIKAICRKGHRPVVHDFHVSKAKYRDRKISFTLAVNAMVGLVHLHMNSTTTHARSKGQFLVSMWSNIFFYNVLFLIAASV